MYGDIKPLKKGGLKPGHQDRLAFSDPMDLKKIGAGFVEMVKPGGKYVRESLNYLDCELILSKSEG